MLRFFDAHIRIEALDETALANLTHFDVRSVLVAAHAPQSFGTTDELLAYFNHLLTNEYHRLQRSGVTPYFALGVHPGAVPSRAHHELWQELPQQLEDPNVVAVGELALETVCATEERLIYRQLEIANSARLPVLITSGSKERARKVRRILEIVKQVGIPPQRVMLNHLDFTCLRPVLEADCWAGITVGALHLNRDEALELIQRYGRAVIERGIVNSGLRHGPKDVLALPKMALALADLGLSGPDVQRLVWSNACRLFGTGTKQSSGM